MLRSSQSSLQLTGHVHYACKHYSQPKRRRRGYLRLRMASAAPEAVQMLTKQDLVDYLRSGCKPRSKWRFGTEHEKLGYFKDSHRRLDYAAIKRLLQGLVSRYGWQPMMEGEYLIGAELDGQSVTLEPGGQFELSGAPLASLHDTHRETHSHLEQVTALAEETGCAFLALGFDPRWETADVPIMPKNRYKIMREYMTKVGSLGHDMMFRSTTIQVNLDFEDERDMVEKMRIGIALQPIATALFANSPFRQGSPTGFNSWRSHVWEDVDADRCGILPFVWEENFGFERYVDYALDVPMYFKYKDGEYKNATSQRTTFRDFMEGKLFLVPGERPTLKDWETHLTTIFPEVRLKRYMEMRGADGGPESSIDALPALWVGLLYDRECQTAAYNMIKDWTSADHEALRRGVPRDGLRTKFHDTTVQELAKQVVGLAHSGLQRRGLGEEKYLAPLEHFVKTGQNAADVLLEKYNNEWHGSVDHCYTAEFSF